MRYTVELAAGGTREVEAPHLSAGPESGRETVVDAADEAAALDLAEEWVSEARLLDPQADDWPQSASRLKRLDEPS